MTPSSRTEWHQRLASIESQGLRRQMRVVGGPAGPIVATPSGEKLLFCSNDYLGMANHPAVAAAMKSAVDTWGSGAGASRLVSGNLEVHETLERASALLLSAASAVLFVSGYQANVGTLSALTESGDAIFSDALVHASLIDGARLSRADVHVYRHNDMDHLRQLLCDHRDYRLRLIATDAVFSMDGDVAALPDIVALAKEHGAAVYLDEAHALGVLGPRGAGLAASLGLADQIDIRIATYSKAMGVAGGFAAVTDTAAALIRSRARSLLYTTAPPPPVAAAALESLKIVSDSEDLRERLRANIAMFRAHARDRSLPATASDTPIQPIITGSNARTMAVSERLFETGFFVQGIRPPTVPRGQGRLRVTLAAGHTEEGIVALTEAVARALREIPA